MIYSVRGKLIHAEPNCAVVECGGVGYMCQIPLSTYSKLSETGSEEMLYTYLNVKQDGIDLFGFKTLEEVSSFKLLTSVSGVGAKAGLSILSDMSPEEITLAVVSGDSKAFTKCAGIGNKISARIVLELKDKFKNVDITGAVSSKGSQSTFAPAGALSEAIAALCALGYTQSEAASALSGADKDLSTEDLIKHGLKTLALR